jgi:predicted transcriptional regulator
MSIGQRCRVADVLRGARFRAPDYDHADGLDLMSKSIYGPIGISCRICEHAGFL